MSLQLEEIQIRAAVELELRRRRQRFRKYAEYPVEFIEKELGFWLTDQQKAIAVNVRDRRETNVQASHGCGKTFLASCLAIWWVLCVEGLCITTAPTKRQVVELLWGEIRRTHGRLNLPGTSGQTFFKLSEDSRAYGFTANDNNSNAFQGIHHPRLLVIEDEACGISPDIDDGASACVTGAGNRFLRIGNPIKTNTPFQRVCAKKHIRIPVWDHPNVRWAYELHEDGIHRLKAEVAAVVFDENGEVKDQEFWPDWCQRDVIPGAVSIAWIEDARTKKGEKSAYWLSRIEGLFALDSASSIIPRSLFLAARARYDADPEHWDAIARRSKWRHGMDVGDGNDDHALSSWRGPVLYAIDKMATQGDDEDTSRAARWAFDILQRQAGSIGIDNCGVGSGALSELRTKLREAGEQDPEDLAFGVNFGSSPTIDPSESEDDHFLAENFKIELYWTLREALRKGEVAIAPLGEYEEELMEDWSGTYYEPGTKGKTRIEDKNKKTRKRLQRSPDCGDAAVYGWASPPDRGVWGVTSAAWSH